MFVMLAMLSRVIASDLPAKAWQAGARQSLSPTEIASSPRLIEAPRNDRKEVSLRY
jgi:hypothetical protein